MRFSNFVDASGPVRACSPLRTGQSQSDLFVSLVLLKLGLSVRLNELWLLIDKRLVPLWDSSQRL